MFGAAAAQLQYASRHACDPPRPRLALALAYVSLRTPPILAGARALPLVIGPRSAHRRGSARVLACLDDHEAAVLDHAPRAALVPPGEAEEHGERGHQLEA